MRAKLLLSSLVLSLVVLTGCDIEDFGGNWQRYSKDFHYSYPLSANGEVSVESFNGSIEVSTWDQNTVDISGTKYGPSQDAADMLRIDTDHTADSVSIRAVRPVERRNNLGAKFILRVPRGAILTRLTTSNGAIHTEDCAGPGRFRTSNGGIRVESFKGRLEAETSNGGIDLIDVSGAVVAHTSNGHIHTERLQGSLDANTSNGSINGDIAHVNHEIRVSTSNGGVDLQIPNEFTQDVHAHTSNGGITLHLPADASAHLVASTSNSSISSEFEVTMQGSFSKNRMDGNIGSGGPLLDLSTSNGAIRLVKM
jgi:DUF4097 and DUF4098 domain-containing protein YvlB